MLRETLFITYQANLTKKPQIIDSQLSLIKYTLHHKPNKQQNN